jgi:hypothetical protein
MANGFEPLVDFATRRMPPTEKIGQPAGQAGHLFQPSRSAAPLFGRTLLGYRTASWPDPAPGIQEFFQVAGFVRDSRF